MSIMLPQPGLSGRSLGVAALYTRYAKFVRRVLRTQGVAQHGLEDATQDVFVVVFRRYDDFVPIASYKTWLFAIAMKVARDHRRRSQRKGGSTELCESEIPCAAADPFAAAAAAQALTSLSRRLEQLDGGRREVFWLAELEQLTAPEIAARLSVKLNTVYSRLRAARRELRLALEGTATNAEEGTEHER
jgi:RNA polymerase sigma-70 factor, ECF subfamily